ncbi:uncharacterized protein B0I36DRAFT_316713 [Microdochium trichocladiopsis]|uniref:Uncharacterized protein n=1 Tax=Microdochium trichocladiopsis TaxID=1682393 RepID=A0A9P8YA06_9PEZI|nr:uncharacterized protein B0I36DRAFT_316713 [Microdochium trichocladiopsis]KAH7034658.1 hypothetical protein B0I36DRAFT_316713 [Microdochium trichocladiopsis]
MVPSMHPVRDCMTGPIGREAKCNAAGSPFSASTLKSCETILPSSDAPLSAIEMPTLSWNDFRVLPKYVETVGPIVDIADVVMTRLIASTLPGTFSIRASKVSPLLGRPQRTSSMYMHHSMNLQLSFPSGPMSPFPWPPPGRAAITVAIGNVCVLVEWSPTSTATDSQTEQECGCHADACSPWRSWLVIRYGDAWLPPLSRVEVITVAGKPQYGICCGLTDSFAAWARIIQPWSARSPQMVSSETAEVAGDSHNMARDGSGGHVS